MSITESEQRSVLLDSSSYIILLAVAWLSLSAADWWNNSESPPSCVWCVRVFDCVPSNPYTGACQLNPQRWWWACEAAEPLLKLPRTLPPGHPAVLSHWSPCSAASSTTSKELSPFSRDAWMAWLLGVGIVVGTRLCSHPWRNLCPESTAEATPGSTPHAELFSELAAQSRPPRSSRDGCLPLRDTALRNKLLSPGERMLIGELEVEVPGPPPGPPPWVLQGERLRRDEA